MGRPDSARAGAERIWEGDFQLGDWLDPDAPPDDPADSKTDKDLVATAYFGWSARHVGRGRGGARPGRRGAALSSGWRTRSEPRHPPLRGGRRRLTSDAATAYALAVVFGLAPDEQTRQAYGDRLAELAAAGADAGSRPASSARR